MIHLPLYLVYFAFLVIVLSKKCYLPANFLPVNLSTVPARRVGNVNLDYHSHTTTQELAMTLSPKIKLFLKNLKNNQIKCKVSW